MISYSNTFRTDLPYKPYLIARINPSREGRYSTEQVEAPITVAPLFSYAYMGSSEFETGAIQESLAALVDFSINCYKILQIPQLKITKGQKEGKCLYALFLKQLNNPVSDLVLSEFFSTGLNDYTFKGRCKEYTDMDNVLNGRESSVIAWHDVQHGVLFSFDYNLLYKFMINRIAKCRYQSVEKYQQQFRIGDDVTYIRDGANRDGKVIGITDTHLTVKEQGPKRYRIDWHDVVMHISLDN